MLRWILNLRRGIRGSEAWVVLGWRSRSRRRSARSPTRRSVRCVYLGRHAFLTFDKNVANVVSCDMDSVGYACDAQYPLENKSLSKLNCRVGLMKLTSVDPGSIPSLALSLAPLAS